MTTAQSDFAHDFGENVPDRDKFMETDIQRFEEIAQGYGIAKVKALVAGFTSVVGSNPYKLIASSIINNRIFPVPGTPAQFLNEDNTLKALGIDYADIKNKFKEEMRKNAATLNTSALAIPNIVFRAPGGEIRTYEVTGVLMKDKRGEGVLNIASRFQTVSKGKSNFALIVDASGGLSMSSIINTDLAPEPPTKSTFFIIENIENDSDSATKLKHFDKPKIPGREAKQPGLLFLQDQTNTVLYPNFKLDAGKSDGELLFGNADLTLSRAGNDMEADFTFPGDPKTYHVENVSQNANVKNASLNILASALAAGGSIDPKTNQLVVPDGVKEPFLFPYIKRVGDWCQALSLLDGARKYNILDSAHNSTGREITLDDLRKDEINNAIGLVTLDRILLGYALALGIDVFFTTASDLRLLIYFHNTETILSDADYKAKITTLRPEYERAFAAMGRDNVSTIIDQGIAHILGSTSDVDYIQRLRGVFYRLSVLRTDFTTLGEKLASINTSLGTVRDAKTAFGLYFEGVTMLKKLKADETHNEVQRTSFATYPSLVEEKSTFTMITTRPGSRAAVAKLKTVLSKDIYNDAVQCQKLFAKYKKQIGVILNRPTVDPVFQDIFTALKEIRVLFGAPMAGGGPRDIESLKQFVVTPLERSVYAAVANGTPPPGVVITQDTPLPLILHSYYRDKESHPYTVIDNYIITEEDLPVFGRIYRDGFKSLPNSDDQVFVASRLLLLYLDILRGQLEALVANEDNVVTTEEIVDPTGKTVERVIDVGPSDVKNTNHKRIYYKAKQMLDIVSAFLSNGEYEDAFTEAFQDYNGTDLLDNDEIDIIAVGKEGIRNPKDFDRTRRKIEEARNIILKDYTPASPPVFGVVASAPAAPAFTFGVSAPAPAPAPPYSSELGNPKKRESVKKGIDPKKAKERRDNALKELRSNKREESLNTIRARATGSSRSKRTRRKSKPHRSTR